ncbi:MAG: ABC-type cobalamin/Fe3+-siderophores transport system ATPase subunit, partial [Alteromonadaceae bacterium]
MPAKKHNTVVNDNPLFVKRVMIKGLFGKKDVDWTLGDVNVLVGQNGSGKSTILRVIYDTLRAVNSPTNDFDHLAEISISFTNGEDISCDGRDISRNRIMAIIGSRIMEGNLPTADEKELSELLARVESKKASVHVHFSGSIMTGEVGAKATKLLQTMYVEYLSTFDMMLLTKKEYDEISGELFTQLDLELEREINRLTQYQLALSNQTLTQASTVASGNDVAAIRASNFSRVNQFEQALNTMFNPNDKRFVISENGVVEVYYYDDAIPLTALSSGEKQLILILLRVVNTSDKPTILLLDEPEISLHLSWQESLIKTIKSINEQCQLIIVTHSPALVMNGWMDSYIDLKDITT